MPVQILNSGDELAQFGSFFFVVELKGSKHLSKAETSNPSDAIRLCFANFKTQFPGLDWNYMCKNGTLLIDLGITHYPIDPTPLSGLWRLDSVEASFGAAGFSMGTIHHLNTLSLYGGLQAEMSRPHMERTHILFRSVYNLAYEVTRPLDNNRELFSNKEAYDFNSDYVGKVAQVTSIYTEEAAYKSFGVRNEIRMGGEAFLRILNDLDLQVNSSIQSIHMIQLMIHILGR